MKLVETSSLWGNLYRSRYYIGGKRVSKYIYDAMVTDISRIPGAWPAAKRTRTTTGSYRYTHTIK